MTFYGSMLSIVRGVNKTLVTTRAFSVCSLHRDTQSPFVDLGIHPAVARQLAKHKITTPTKIQTQGIPAVLKERNVFLFDQTGSGKTLCYLLPFLDEFVRKNEAASASARTTSWSSSVQGVKGIVIVPNALLVSQICGVFNALAEPFGLEAAPIHVFQRLRVHARTKLVVASVDSVSRGNLHDLCAGVELLVLDNFGNGDIAGGDLMANLKRLLSPKVRGRPRASFPRVVYVGATLHPRAAGTARLIAWTKDMSAVRPVKIAPANSSYHVPPSLEFAFEKYAAGGKARAIVKCLKSLRPTPGAWKPPVTVIHCSDGKEVAEVARLLETVGEWYSEDEPALMQVSNWWQFQSAPITDLSTLNGYQSGTQSLSAVQAGLKAVLIAHGQDLAGVDLQDVEAVVLASFADLTDVEDFLEVAGRTGRVGKPGKVFCLVPSLSTRSPMSVLLENVLAHDQNTSFSLVSRRHLTNKTDPKLTTWRTTLRQVLKSSDADGYMERLDEHVDAMLEGRAAAPVQDS